jgi:hypothetical protein
MIVDERDHGLNRRLSSAWAKYADALHRILSYINHRFLRSNAFSFAAISDGTLGARPASRSTSAPIHAAYAASSQNSRLSNHRRPVRGMFVFVLQHYPHRPVTDFRRKFVRRRTRHGSILFGSWSLRQTRGGSVLAEPAITSATGHLPSSAVTLCCRSSSRLKPGV